ncbi:pyridoxamine 5'-phosphate oxidase family protein [Sphingomonas sp. HITSZ_GF]|uniref:pyridoxamine 5'-phosphate oxidase family protein n=1 Tax=Sphingomonas sp. HITSZ_GF TaxID=3037247 RepID=UPI00240DAEB4|nr:pyridoxamine 5'-phosphate oxidase family protein [Sphingomonas sp. HITSZ_GF]MDG2533572.1 pyridoxamine 5'-phosphate oxidase family protein [Sphingomonas sp. HITSZ_GF]
MAKFFESIDAERADFIARAPMFFVATAAVEGRINLSPKGMDSFRVLGPNRVAWLDVAGSGNETHAHLVADGRITVMFCAFENPALILRLYGRAVPVLPQDEGWAALEPHFALLPGTRQIFDMVVESVQTACGWGVPHMHLERERDTLNKYNLSQGREARFAKYAVRTHSIDGLPVRTPTREPR